MRTPDHACSANASVDSSPRRPSLMSKGAWKLHNAGLRQGLLTGSIGTRRLGDRLGRGKALVVRLLRRPDRERGLMVGSRHASRR